MHPKHLALVALTTLLAACGGGDNGATGPGSGPGGTPQTAVPAELVGSWYHGSVSPSNFYDPNSGHWDNAYGEGLFYTLKADGHFEYGYRVYTSAYGCTDAALFWKTGTVTVDSVNHSFTVYPTQAILHSESSCHPEWNYDKPIAKDPETVIWQFGQDDWGGDALLLSYPTSGASAFYPWNP